MPKIRDLVLIHVFMCLFFYWLQAQTYGCAHFQADPLLGWIEEEVDPNLKRQQKSNWDVCVLLDLINRSNSMVCFQIDES